VITRRRRPAEMHHTSREYLHVPVTAPVGVVLATQVVSISLVEYGADPGGYQAAAWDSAQAAGRERDAVLLIGAGTTLAETAGDYSVWVKVTDNPEIPVQHAGLLRIT
jgi:hypothetical protein